MGFIAGILLERVQPIPRLLLRILQIKLSLELNSPWADSQIARALAIREPRSVVGLNESDHIIP